MVFKSVVKNIKLLVILLVIATLELLVFSSFSLSQSCTCEYGTVDSKNCLPGFSAVCTGDFECVCKCGIETSCDDNNLCTQDTCFDGACWNPPTDSVWLCEHDGGTCNPETGECEFPDWPECNPNLPGAKCCTTSGYFMPKGTKCAALGERCNGACNYDTVHYECNAVGECNELGKTSTDPIDEGMVCKNRGTSSTVKKLSCDNYCGSSEKYCIDIDTVGQTMFGCDGKGACAASNGIICVIEECEEGEVCDDGVCVDSCDPKECETCNCGTILDGCGGTLTCGDICEGGSSCYEGFCICDELFYLSCDGDPCNYDCEVDSRTNIEHCGECDYDCREENPDRTPYYENEYCEDRECKIRCRGTPCSKGEYKCIDEFDGKTYYCVNSTPFYFSSSFVFNPLGSKGTEIYCEENEYYRNGYCTDKTATNLDHCYFDCEKTGMASLFDERNACGGERGYCNFTNGAMVSNIGIQNLKIAPEVDKTKIRGQGSFPHAYQVFGYNYKVFEKNPDNYSTVGFSLLAKFDSKGRRTESNLYWDVCNNNNRLVERYSIPDFFSTESASLYSKTYNCECLNITSGNYKFAICKTPPTSSSTKTEIKYSV